MSALARHRRGAAGAAATALLVLTTGCGVLIGPNNGEVSDDITVTSPMLREGEKLPDRYTCGGEGMSPPLRWSGLPAATESLALVVDDVRESGAATVHWVVYGLDPDNPELPEGTVPIPAQQGMNSFETAGYEPLCPGKDDEHEFRFTVYALSEPLGLGEAAPLDVALGAIATRTLARGRLTSVP
ncbi:YbhB/YbcL family Raf kinase inhibitor-like protein [Thermobifida alba]|jgi:Raf kinase inhibitor-like YbhB/YbcL family protein|uniref:YbhB/YbcL family Raf kinase inhibitor-like protein n=1 Tax=Thermobifida alba TaxID=53522 RepID=A0ABY4L0G3_THEAE|nr:YbhB/YbcL family Raf kinase inhibitor-like protein [Thermobifida alba]UPT21157.1 YbhB/YbcL family Raf kinase inhibitor-like protein [Thermobifida alba]